MPALPHLKHGAHDAHAFSPPVPAWLPLSPPLPSTPPLPGVSPPVPELPPPGLPPEPSPPAAISPPLPKIPPLPKPLPLPLAPPVGSAPPEPVPPSLALLASNAVVPPLPEGPAPGTCRPRLSRAQAVKRTSVPIHIFADILPHTLRTHAPNFISVPPDDTRNRVLSSQSRRIGLRGRDCTAIVPKRIWPEIVRLTPASWDR